ncbi:MAG: radical SAM protein [Candidatus Margulisiibacteriota bacterium]
MLTRKIFDPYRPSLPFGHQKPKVLLVDPSFKTRQHPESLGLAYVAAAVHQAGFDVSVESFNWEGACEDIDQFEIQEDELLRNLSTRISRENISVVGVTVHTYDVGRAMRTAKSAREAGAIVILGGPHITAAENDPQIRGYLLEKLANGVPILDVPSLSFLNDGQYQITPEQSGIKELTELRPFWQIFGARLASTAYLPILASLGCIYRCNFCTAKGPRLIRPPSEVIEEVVSSVGITRKFGFHDLSFTSYPHLVQLHTTYNNSSLPDNLCLCASGRVNEVIDRKNELPLLKEFGLLLLMLGVESGDNQMLHLMRKGITSEQSLEAFRLLKEAGIRPKAYMLVGYPGETTETITKSINFINHRMFSDWHIYIPETEAYKLAARIPRGIDTDLPIDLFIERWGPALSHLNPLILASAFTAQRPSPQYHSMLRDLSVIHPPSGLPFSELLRPILS